MRIYTITILFTILRSASGHTGYRV